MTFDEPTAAAAEALHQRKRQIRVEARTRQKQQSNKGGLSAEICRRLLELPEYLAAATILCYIDFAAEVQTRPLLPVAWRQSKRLAVPYCVGDDLELFELRSFDELTEGSLGILEPTAELRLRAERRVEAEQLDLIVVPGLAFDRHGGRLGRGKGYYDRLLRRVPSRTALVAVCFECQLFPEIPMLPHDIYVDKVITENAIYQSNRSR